MRRDAIDFANQPVPQLFRKMFVPTLIGMLSIVVLTITDGAFVGHGCGSDALAAINIAAPIFNLMAGIALMFGVGCSVVASIHLSRGKHKAANINVTQALVGCTVVAVGISALILADLPATCRLFGSSEALIPLAGSYLRWIALCEPLIMLDMVGRFLVRLDGSPRFAMTCSIVASTLNIFLDWLFIFPFGWGLEGAAMATSLSFSLTGIAQLFYLIFFTKTLHLYRLRFSLKSFLLTLRNLGYQMRMGCSAMLGEVAICGAMIVGNFVFIAYLGEAGVAAYSVACYCLPIVFMMANAIVQSGQPIVSFAYGADNAARLTESRRLMLRWALVAGTLTALPFLLGAPFITRIFLNPDAEAFALSVEGLPYYGTGVLFITLNVVLVGYLQSVGQSLRATVFTLLRGFVLVIPCFLLLPLRLGIPGIWIAVPVAEILTLAAILLTLRCPSFISPRRGRRTPVC
ncbi:MAG: MATE family efflux transporter [Bacteroidales bacterium]|nr:MATE family efflux transporter [Candidatus Equimonas faecalis]